MRKTLEPVSRREASHKHDDSNGCVGILRKMRICADDSLRYFLPVGAQEVSLNERLGEDVHLHFQGVIHCIHCGRRTNKSYQQGYCFPCARKLARCDLCMVRPERCHYDEGTCREPDWAQQHCFQPHYVYLANTSGLKVGMTRASQCPARWLDQGARQAIVVFKVASRLQAGLLETAIARGIADKTDWRRLLKTVGEPLDLEAERERVWARVARDVDDLKERFGETAVQRCTDAAVSFDFPVMRYPLRIETLSFDRCAALSGTLLGLKGQYLMLDCGVLNIRKFAGYTVSFR